MTDYQPHHELDDELLSAYLDDELSGEERAAVEARLASDPAAQQMLHQLRAVSQAVQALPQETLGHDLREVVLRRAEQVKAGTQPKAAAVAAADARAHSSGEAASPVADSLPKFTIGRTRRGWLWASMAVAAALLVMVFQPDSEQDNGLPGLAQRNDRITTDDMGRGALRRELELRVLNEPAAAPTTAGELSGIDAAAPADSGPGQSGFAENGSLREPMPASGAPRGEGLASRARTDTAMAPPGQSTQRDAASTELFTAVPQGAESQASPAGEPADAPSRTPLAEHKTQFTNEPLVVVRVLAKRAALEDNAFERLLEGRGIVVEEPPADEFSSVSSSEAPADRFAPQDQDDQRRTFARARPEIEQADGEAKVLYVEAVPTAIDSCLEELHSDTANYLGVAVDDSLAKDTGAMADADAVKVNAADGKEPVKSKLATELGWAKYSRGFVPQQEELLERSKTQSFYYQSAAESDRYSDFGGGGAGVPGGLDRVTQQVQPDTRKQVGQATQGRALRLRTGGVEQTPYGSGQAAGGRLAPTQAPATAKSLQLGSVRRERTALAPSVASETMPVLFVLTPQEEAAPSTPAADRAE